MRVLDIKVDDMICFRVIDFAKFHISFRNAVKKAISKYTGVRKHEKN